MKKLMLITSVFALIGMASCCDCNKSKYKIINNRDYRFYTDEYKTDGTCISFISKHTGRRITICGSYSIIEIQNK